MEWASPGEGESGCSVFEIVRGLEINLGRKAEAETEREAVERLREDQAEFGRIRQALIEAPRDPELRAKAARWLMTHGHEEEAVEWANLVLGTQPSHPQMNRLLADYYRKKGQPGLANLHQALAGPSDGHAEATPGAALT